MKYNNIRVLVARSQFAAQSDSFDDVRPCDTIAEAKKFARYALDPKSAYQSSNEMAEPMNYAEIRADEDGRDVCVDCFWRRGYSEPVMAEEAT